ncbi:MAG: hypothetical protein EOM40_10440 [Clostridia bacterium]|nr:hypothetical protein [Clostridia bacterium]
MWKCPKCGREFVKTNQSHYCGEKPKTIDEYIQSQPEDIQPFLADIRNVIQRAIPGAHEKISWSMPTYYKKHNIIQFAASAHHIGIYPGPEAVEHFADRLKKYKTNKGTIRIPYENPLPLELISDIASWCGALESAAGKPPTSEIAFEVTIQKAGEQE